MDNAKGNAKSAGATLRRYNEQALSDVRVPNPPLSFSKLTYLFGIFKEIRDLLASWSDRIASSEAIFIRASRSNYKIFFDYNDAVLDRKDPRIRNFPFPTRRPVRLASIIAIDRHGEDLGLTVCTRLKILNRPSTSSSDRSMS
jgi:hypothetical protein